MIDNFAPKKETDGSLIKLMNKFCFDLFEPISVEVLDSTIKTESFIFDGQFFKIGSKNIKIGSVSIDENGIYYSKIIIGKLVNGVFFLTPEPIKFLYGSKHDFIFEITESEKYKGYTGLVVGLKSPVSERRLGAHSQISTSLFFGYKYDKTQNLTPKKKSIEIFDDVILPNIELFRSKLKFGRIYEQMESYPDIIKHDSVEVVLSENENTTLLFTFCEVKNIKLGFKI